MTIGAGIALAALILSVLPPGGSAHANWFDQTLGKVRELWAQTAVHRRDSDWQMATSLVARLPAAAGRGALAATVAGRGHWTFATREGQHFTVASPAEMQRIATVLFPEGAGPNGLTIYLSPGVVFDSADQLQDLPAAARLRLVAGRTSYPVLVRRASGRNAAQLFVAVRRDVLVGVRERRVFDEIRWQLERPLGASRMRLLSVLPDGPAALASAPARRANSGSGPVIEPIATRHLARALADLTGQTALFAARIDADTLVFRAPDASEQSLAFAAIKTAASKHDVRLAILNARAPRQPGARNWLWQTVDIDGLAAALQRETLADFLGSLAIAGAKVEVNGATSGDRVTLTVSPAGQGLLPSPDIGLAGVIAEIASEVVGTVVPAAVRLELVSAARTRELERRIVPGVPSIVQIGFLCLVLFGLLTYPVAARWWQVVWPPETRADYGGRFGYEAARAARHVAFVLLFLPLVGMPAMIWAALRFAGRLVLAPLRSR